MDILQAFLNREEIAGVLYMHNDYVRVVAGRFEDSLGSLVNLVDLQPEPRFVLELDTGMDVQVKQSEIQLIAR
ncbi:hypothetical protein [Rhodanobacter sp. L36]|uniref:hypothetical protein n=1 Tax=Rhodanobacter sp. L36 TaxID=1747221 RepID=UPI00131B1548|nr:hypothetical protein [Rhodanobacter sp. L36]